MKYLLTMKSLCTFHDGCKQGIDQQIFNRKSISRKITHPQSLFRQNSQGSQTRGPYVAARAICLARHAFMEN